MGIKDRVLLRLQSASNRPFDVAEIEIALKETKNAIRCYDTAHALDRLLLQFRGNLRQPSCRAIWQRSKLFKDPVRQFKKARQPRLRARHSGAAKEKHLPFVARDQEIVRYCGTVFLETQV